MLPGVQLIADSDSRAEALSRSLAGHGYLVMPPETATFRPPAVYIVDLTHFERCPELSWEGFVNTCRAHGAACLVYSSGDPPDRTRIAELKPAADILPNPEDLEDLRARIESLLTIRELSRQLETAQNQSRAQQKELQEALLSAAHIQRRLIPAQYPVHQGFEFAWQFMPSKKVGGDLFNIARLDEQTVMTYLVDVSGHGISSAMISVSVHQSLSPRTGQLLKRQTDHPPYYKISSPANVLKALDEEYPFERFEEFFTISYLLLDADSGRVRYANGGHPPPLLLCRTGEVKRLPAGGTIIGMGTPLDFSEAEIQMSTGDRLFLYTDGITEHYNQAGEAYGEQRLLDGLVTNRDERLERVCQTAIDRVMAFDNGRQPQDDVTLIGIEFRQKGDAE
jgi:sigma-B regulation protein RsbU (phosphoserine phosphatase)